MPLLRLTSLIVSTLLLAALSALAPMPKDSNISLANHTYTDADSGASRLAHKRDGLGSTRLQALVVPHPYEGELIRIAGQSIPKAGQ